MVSQSRVSDCASPVDPEEVQRWLYEAGNMALDHWREYDVWLKADRTPVTSVDTAIESYLLDQIARCDPDGAVLSEEAGFRSGRGPFVWVLDPLDGTRAYASGLPIWGICLGLLREGKPYAGAFFLPAVRQMYWADGCSALCNGLPIAARPPISFDDPLAFMAVPSDAHRLYDIAFPRLRSLGSTAAHLTYVANSTAIAALTRLVNLWDIAGVLPLMAHCGIVLEYLSGAPFEPEMLLGGQPVPEPLLAAPASVLPQARALIAPRGKG